MRSYETYDIPKKAISQFEQSGHTHWSDFGSTNSIVYVEQTKCLTSSAAKNKILFALSVINDCWWEYWWKLFHSLHTGCGKRVGVSPWLQHKYCNKLDQQSIDFGILHNHNVFILSPLWIQLQFPYF